MHLKNGKDVQEKSHSQSIACQWHHEEEQTNQNRQHTSHKPNKNKAISFIFPNEVITIPNRIH